MTKNIEFPTFESALIAFNKDGYSYYPNETEIACVESKACPDCQSRVYFLVPVSATLAYAISNHVTESFPMLDNHQRERLITGYCFGCWNDLFSYMNSELDDDDDEE